ncbi:cell-division protein [Clostridium sp. CAG:567]|jgi:cell division transport system permease protein|nr:cell-division protein [Clostridium sp. CAG:567]
MIRGVDIVVRYSIFGYLLGEGFRNVFKNKKSTIASLVIMCATMFIFGLFFAVGQNVNHITKTIEEQQGMEVFIYDEATEEQRTELKNKIRSIPYVNTIEEKSKEQALEEMKKMFKDKKFLWATYDGENNPFKASFVVTLTDLTKAEEVKTEIADSTEVVSNIEVRTDTINALIKIADGINIITTVILIILVLISIFIITNTIKLTVHARRKEISIMKYVGATNSFIRWPFMVEGMLIGLISVLISLLILSVIYNAVIAQIQQSLINGMINIPLLTFQELFKTLLTVYLVLGLGVGALGSAISMKKYLEV